MHMFLEPGTADSHILALMQMMLTWGTHCLTELEPRALIERLSLDIPDNHRPLSSIVRSRTVYYHNDSFQSYHDKSRLAPWISVSQS